MKHILGISLRPVAHPRLGRLIDFGSLALLAVGTGAAVALVLIAATKLALRWIAP